MVSFVSGTIQILFLSPSFNVAAMLFGNIACFFRTINSYKSTISIKSKGTTFTALQINFHSFLRLLVVVRETFRK